MSGPEQDAAARKIEELTASHQQALENATEASKEAVIAVKKANSLLDDYARAERERQGKR